ncbi:MAG TPA: hypothetical protein VGZ27_06820 [Vicinamibacterales bacterium]|jgi:hypothetical protein|nr:hypothetical protein [Vicinamibacterales bacterium]
MWQPNAAQWRLIWIAAVLLILAWPAENGSLARKAINRAADPFQALPRLPSPLTMGLDDDMDTVQQHDAEEAAYYTMYAGSRMGRLRLQLRDLQDPFDPSTERQVLVGLAILSALGVWRANKGGT